MYQANLYFIYALLRHVHTATVESIPPISAFCQKFLCSEPFCLLLAHITGLDLARNVVKPPIEDDDNSNISSESGDSSWEDEPRDTGTAVTPEPNGRRHEEASLLASDAVNGEETNGPVALCHAQIHHWQPGDYTLVSDTDPEIGEYALDATVYFCCEGKCY